MIRFYYYFDAFGVGGGGGWGVPLQIKRLNNDAVCSSIPIHNKCDAFGVGGGEVGVFRCKLKD